MREPLRSYSENWLRTFPDHSWQSKSGDSAAIAAWRTGRNIRRTLPQPVLSSIYGKNDLVSSSHLAKTSPIGLPHLSGACKLGFLIIRATGLVMMKIRTALMGVCAATAATAAAGPIPLEAGHRDQLTTSLQTVDGRNRMIPATTLPTVAGKRTLSNHEATGILQVPTVRQSQPTKPMKRRSHHYFRDMDCPAPHMRHPHNGSCRTPDQHESAKREAEWFTLIATTAGAAASLYGEAKCIKLLKIKRGASSRKGH